MSEFADEEPTPEEILQISQHFMLSSPPGQFKEVSADVKKLIPSGILTDSLEMGIARAYNIKNNKVVKAPSGKNVTITKAGEIDATHYFDPSNGSTFAIDHITLESTDDVVDVNNIMDNTIELKRAELQNAIDSYISSTFNDATAAGCVYAKDGKLNIVITGEKSNLRNFWGGKWSSTWDVNLDGNISGEIKVHAHYFEDGNVQLQTTKPIKLTKLSSYTVENIIKYINDTEYELQKSLGMMYMNMDQETFKSIRRILPVTKLKMDWNIARTNLTSNLQAGLK